MSILTVAGALIIIALLVLWSLRGRKGAFSRSVQAAIKALQDNGRQPAQEMSETGAIKDLELQWNDHFHMRDQSWKTLSNAALLFVGVIGLEVYAGTPRIIMLVGYTALILVSAIGLIIALHHRYIQQKIKFPIILRYEIMLGLVSVFQDILDRHSNKGFSTSTFIVFALAAMCVIAILLLSMKVYEAQVLCANVDMACLLDRATEPGAQPAARWTIPDSD